MKWRASFLWEIISNILQVPLLKFILRKLQIGPLWTITYGQYIIWTGTKNRWTVCVSERTTSCPEYFLVFRRRWIYIIHVMNFMVTDLLIYYQLFFGVEHDLNQITNIIFIKSIILILSLRIGTSHLLINGI